MAIRDILSNYASTGILNFVGEGANDIGQNGVTENSTTRQQDQSVGTTTYMEFLVHKSDVGNGAVIASVEFKYTDDGTTDFNTDLTAQNNLTTTDPGDLGNSIIDLQTGLPPVFPYDVDANGTLILVAAVVNPVDTSRYVMLYVNDSADAGEIGAGICLRGPLRFTGEA